MALAARDAMVSDQIEAIADKGYYKSEEILACEEAGSEVVVPKPQTSNSGARGQTAGKQTRGNRTWIIERLPVVHIHRNQKLDKLSRLNVCVECRYLRANPGTSKV